MHFPTLWPHLSCQTLKSYTYPQFQNRNQETLYRAHLSQCHLRTSLFCRASSLDLIHWYTYLSKRVHSHWTQRTKKSKSCLSKFFIECKLQENHLRIWQSTVRRGLLLKSQCYSFLLLTQEESIYQFLHDKIVLLEYNMLRILNTRKLLLSLKSKCQKWEERVFFKEKRKCSKSLCPVWLYWLDTLVCQESMLLDPRNSQKMKSNNL